MELDVFRHDLKVTGPEAVQPAMLLYLPLRSEELEGWLAQ